MEINEVKKSLYRQKPTAMLLQKDEDVYCYEASLEDGSVIFFEVPISDMGDAKFENEIPAHLLIRWITN